MTASRQLLFLLTVVVAAGATGLGVWQLDRLFDRRARNRGSLIDSRAGAIDLTTEPLAGPVRYRRVTVSGWYDHEREFVLRGRLLRGTPGVQVVTPLRIPGQDTAVLVNRGFVPTPDAGYPLGPNRYAEPGIQAIEGIAIDLPDEGDGQPLSTGNGETWHRLDRRQFGDRLPYPVRPYYVIATVDTTRTREHTVKGTSLPVRVEPPALDDGPHLSYAVQWFMIAGAALGFGIVFVRRRPPAGPLAPPIG